jgi:hypothetical protein
MADFPLNTYRSAASKLHEIRDAVSRREMPPWPADPAASLAFSNDPRLDPRDIATILAWIDGGAPQGDAADLPPAPIFAETWTHPDGRPPDAVVTLPRLALAANGEVPYLEQLIKVPFPNDRWLSAIEVRAGNPGKSAHRAAGRWWSDRRSRIRSRRVPTTWSGSTRPVRPSRVTPPATASC